MKKISIIWILFVTLLLSCTGVGAEKGTLTTQTLSDGVIRQTWSFKTSGATFVNIISDYGTEDNWVEKIYCPDGSTTHWYTWYSPDTNRKYFGNSDEVKSVYLKHKENGDWLYWQTADGDINGQWANCTGDPETAILKTISDIEKQLLFPVSGLILNIKTSKHSGGYVDYDWEITCPDGSKYTELDRSESANSASYQNGTLAYQTDFDVYHRQIICHPK